MQSQPNHHHQPTRGLRQMSFDLSKPLDPSSQCTQTNLSNYNISHIRLKVGVMLQNLAKICDEVQQQKDFQQLCPCQGQIHCHLCSDAYQQIPDDIESLEHFVYGTLKQQDQAEGQPSTNNNNNFDADHNRSLNRGPVGFGFSHDSALQNAKTSKASTAKIPRDLTCNQSGHKFDLVRMKNNGLSNNGEDYRQYLLQQAQQKHQQILQTRMKIIQSGTYSQNQNGFVKQYGYISPFESSTKPEMPLALYFDILCQKMRMPDEHLVIVLGLIERFFRTKSRREIQKFVNSINCPNQQLNQMEEQFEEQETLKCSFFENPQIFWTGEMRMTSGLMHRLVLSAVLITHKFYSDFFYKNSAIGLIGGLFNTSELNELELSFLEAINWRVKFDAEDHTYYMKGLEDFFTQPLSQMTKNVIDDVVNKIQSMPHNANPLKSINMLIGSSFNMEQRNQQKQIQPIVHQQTAQSLNNIDECEIPDERPEDSLHPVHKINSQKSKLVHEDQSMFQCDEEWRNPNQHEIKNSHLQDIIKAKELKERTMNQLRQVNSLIKQGQEIQMQNMQNNPQFIQQQLNQLRLSQQAGANPNLNNMMQQQQQIQQIQQMQQQQYIANQNMINYQNQQSQQMIPQNAENDMQMQCSPFIGASNQFLQSPSILGFNNMNQMSAQYQSNQVDPKFGSQIQQNKQSMQDQHIIQPIISQAQQFQAQSPFQVQQIQQNDQQIMEQCFQDNYQQYANAQGQNFSANNLFRF